MIRQLLLGTLTLSLVACGATEQPKKAGPETPNITETTKPETGTPFAVSDAYVLAPLIGSTQTAAFLKISALTDAPASLISASSPQAGAVELHTHTMANGVMSMKMVEFIDIPIQGTAELRPHGDHIMLFDLTTELKEGDTVKLELVLLSGGDPVVLTIDAPVRPLI